jgi:hypothetical protein
MSGEQSEQELAAEDSKHPGGRPSLYKPEYCQWAEDLGKEGKSQEQIAATIDVDPATLRRWSDAYPEFRLALTRAKMFEQAWWEDVGQTALFAEKFNSAVWSKSMSSRFREKYSEKVIQEQTGPNGGPIQNVTEIRLVGG